MQGSGIDRVYIGICRGHVGICRGHIRFRVQGYYHHKGEFPNVSGL